MMRQALRAGSALAAVLALALSACGGSDTPSQGDTGTAGTGPISIWYSNDPHEVTWGNAVVASWNKAHPDEKVTAQQIPAGKSSEEVIGASIAAGNTPCLIYNTAPSAVAQFQAQGGLVNLSRFPDGNSYIEDRTGDDVDQYKSADGDYYQLPWKADPPVIYYNKDMFAKVGVDPSSMATYDGFLAGAKKIDDSGIAEYAVYANPSTEYYQRWFDYYPNYIAESLGSRFVENGTSTITSDAATRVMEFWQKLYADNLADEETYTGDPFSDKVVAMEPSGPSNVLNYNGKVNWGTIPFPTSTGSAESQTYLFDDSKSVGMYTSCTYRQTAWNFLKYSTSPSEDAAFIQTTGQIPLRADTTGGIDAYFAAHPEYSIWSMQDKHMVSVPVSTNSIEEWQDFSDSWSKAVIFRNGDLHKTMQDTAKKINTLEAQG